MRHTHYTVQGYDEEISGMGGIPILQGQVTLDLIATNEAVAHLFHKGQIVLDKNKVAHFYDPEITKIIY